MHSSRSHDAGIRVYDRAGNVIGDARTLNPFDCEDRSSSYAQAAKAD